jgi:hypothetical protein
MSRKITCYFCKQDGHTVYECPTCPPCAKCHKKGHSVYKCRETTSAVEVKPEVDYFAYIDVPEVQDPPAEVQDPPAEVQDPPAEVQDPPAEVQDPPDEVQDANHTLPTEVTYLVYPDNQRMNWALEMENEDL